MSITLKSNTFLWVPLTGKWSLQRSCEENIAQIVFFSSVEACTDSTQSQVAHYCACIRSTLDYACPLFHHALTKYHQLDLQRVQKRALSHIIPQVPHCEALKLAEIESVWDHTTIHVLPKNCSSQLWMIPWINFMICYWHCNVMSGITKERKEVCPTIMANKETHGLLWKQVCLRGNA